MFHKKLDQYLNYTLGQPLQYSNQLNYKSSFLDTMGRYNHIQLDLNIMRHQRNLQRHCIPDNLDRYNLKLFEYYMFRHPRSHLHCTQNNPHQNSHKQLDFDKIHHRYLQYYQEFQCCSLMHCNRSTRCNLNPYNP